MSNDVSHKTSPFLESHYYPNNVLLCSKETGTLLPLMNDVTVTLGNM